MSHDTAMTLLPIFAIGAVLTGIVLGYLLGCEGTLLAQRMAAAAIKRARKARRVARQERAAATRAEGLRALAVAQRAEAVEQLAAAERVIAESTHAVARAGTLPDLVDDPGTEALMRAVTDESGRALGAPARPTGRHAQPEPLCESITTRPDYAGVGDPELWCVLAAGHDGRHISRAEDVFDDDVTWDDEGETWVGGVLQ